MEKALLDIVAALHDCEQLDNRALTKLINKNNKRIVEEQRRTMNHVVSTRPLSKKRLMEYYLATKQHHPEQLDAWGITPEMDMRLTRTLQMKPRRTASGVATITVLTKPWKCSSDCLYCPNDLRMPKSYLADEPACQRAERNYFDPYLQVTARLRALNAMGHVTDKVELIVLGGTWSDYPKEYQLWFMRELFRALNDAPITGAADSQPTTTSIPSEVSQRIAWYEQTGLARDPAVLSQQVASLQHDIAQHTFTYNQAFDKLYGTSEAWKRVARHQTATLSELQAEHTRNETAPHRVVGLVIETRPDNITLDTLIFMRTLGCTKIQMGIQSLDEKVLKANKRQVTPHHIQRAFEACRLLGFKTHVHAMVNLYGATPTSDKYDYRRLVTETPYQPDEIKLYPCALIDGTHLCTLYEQGAWKPYDEETLIDVLVADTCATPPFTRISRMIRDFSAPDIMAGNKKVNLRQMVEDRIDSEGYTTAEIRHREISLADTDPASLRLDIVPYETTISHEYFLQWVTPENRIAGFLRLSLPHQEVIHACCEQYASPAVPATDSATVPATNSAARTTSSGQTRPSNFPIAAHEAMIREVHIYGRAARLHNTSGSAQHRGLGKQLIEQACDLAHSAGYTKINVISAIGTRDYYRKLQFYDHGLYQQRALT